MNSNKKISIANEIRKAIRKRLFYAFCTLFALVVAISAFELIQGVNDLEKRLQAQADELSDAVVSEVLVKNEDAIQFRLDEIKEREKFTNLRWIDNGSPSSLGLQYVPPFGWQYFQKLESEMASGDYGYLVFSGDVSQDQNFLKPLMLQIFLLAMFCLIVAFTLLPLSKDIPKKYFLGPTMKLVDAFRGDFDERKINDLKRYKEFDPVVSDLEKYIKERAEMDRVKAIADVAQMVAHDVRRPFSMLEAGIRILERLKNPRDYETKKGDVVDKVSMAKSRIESYVNDITQLGTEKHLELIKLDFSLLLKTSLDLVMENKTGFSLDIAIDLQHEQMIHGDENMILRVLSNLIENAVDATGKQGQMWIRTRDVGSDQVKIIIGNSGKCIEQSDLNNIFDLHFTKGKEGGTGLGLAIVKRFVEKHGGSISCRSNDVDGTEFTFFLPKTEGVVSSDIKIPVRIEKQESSQTKSIAKYQSNKLINILIVEDDEIFQLDLEMMLSDLFATHASIHSIAVSRELPQDVESIDLIFCDVDLGKNSANGFEIVKQLRKSGCMAAICILSNRIGSENELLATNAGADCFISKPITGEALREICNELGFPPLGELDCRLNVALIEDDQLFADDWISSIPQTSVHHFTNPNAFKEALASGDVSGIDCVITDFNFDECLENGEDVSEAVAEHFPEMPVIVTTGRPIRGAVADKFDYKTGKQPLDQKELEKIISKIRSVKARLKAEAGE